MSSSQWTAAALAVVACLGTGRAMAQDEVTLDEATAMLAAGDPDQIQAGIEALGLIGTPRIIEPLAQRIRRGLPRDLLSSAVEILGMLARPEAGPILFELATHRRPDVRLAAVNAITACRPSGAERALVVGLSDSDPRVRSAAAVGLGELGARGQVDTLFLALDRGILEAATAVGRLVDGPQVGRLLEHLGRLPFDVVSPGLNEVLARAEIPERVKLEVIARLQELATPDVKAFLQELLASLPQRRGRDAIRQAVQDAIERIVD